MSGTERKELTVTALDTVEMQPIVYLDKPIWQASAFHLLAGRKNAGKGTFLAHEAARVTRGELGERRHVLWLAQGEDSYSIDVRPRLEVAGAAIKHISILKGHLLRLPDDGAELARVANTIGAVGMIVIDPISACLSGGKNSNLDTDVRAALTGLNGLADLLQCVIVGVRHITNKATSSDALGAVLGSSDWVNIPRAVLGLVKDNEDDDLRHLTVLTGNRGKSGGGRVYRLEGAPSPVKGGEDVVRAVLVDDVPLKHADDLIRADQPTSRSGIARELILDLLEQAPDRRIESDTLDAIIAEKAGVSAGTAKNLRTQLSKAGLIRNVPVKDDRGKVVNWNVVRTNAERPTSPLTTTRDLDVTWTVTGENPESTSRPHHDITRQGDLGLTNGHGDPSKIAVEVPPFPDENIPF